MVISDYSFTPDKVITWGAGLLSQRPKRVRHGSLEAQVYPSLFTLCRDGQSYVPLSDARNASNSGTNS